MSKEFEEEYEVEKDFNEVSAGISVEDLPIYGTKEWEDYVMSLFYEDEVIEDGQNKLILCRGLRRVANLILGNILYSKPTQVIINPDGGPGHATVVYEIAFDWMNSGETKVFGDVAETWHGNTDPIFAGHAAATACTKAEGRTFRKALMVNCLAFEEMPHNVDVEAAVKKAMPEKTTDGEISSSDSITDKQLKFMQVKCGQLGIDVNKYVIKGTDGKFNHPEQLSKKDGIGLIQKLNQYQNGETKIPEELLL